MILSASSLRSTANAIVVTSFLLLVATACGRDESTPLIFAAASLADALTESAEAYETSTGNRVEFNFGGSTALANQIARLDSPADGVIFAGESPIELLVTRGMVDRADVVVVARNSLVVVSAGESVLNSLGDLSLSDYRIAIADPQLAPAGQYTKEALESAGVWDDIGDRVIPTLDVRAAVAAASSRSVDFAIVYATDAVSEPELNIVLSVDTSLHQPVVYPAAVISGSSAANETLAFLDFLLGPVGQQIMRNHEFSAN